MVTRRWSSSVQDVPMRRRRSRAGRCCCSRFELTELIAWLSEIPKAHVFLHCRSSYILAMFHRSHIVYREVHMSDLIRSHEGNPDTLEGDPSKIRWGKYSMMGRFVSTIMQCQAQCIATKDYSFVPRNDIKRMLETPYLMNEDVCPFLPTNLGFS